MANQKEKSGNPKRVCRYVMRDEYEKLLEQCPDREWRVILALARYGGLRCPSEVLRIRWTDIDWKGKGLHVRRYTKITSGRTVPLFPDIRKELEALFHAVKKEKNEFVVNQFADRKTVNLVGRFHQMVRRAEISLIPRPFGSFRCSRASELMDKFGMFLTCNWLGVTPHTFSSEDFVRAVSKKEIAQAAEWQG